ncbi:MAG: DUF58 domain-containing protein [Phycisphaeraceae bacterium]|nr:DUF58 domain-containing protein [Phycisphaeraceae bacterium]
MTTAGAISPKRNATLPAPAALAQGDFEVVVRRLADDLAFGADNSLFTGGGLEYAGSRPYQPGDSIRILDWRLTARTGRAFVKEHEALKRVCVYLVVDTSASMSRSSSAVSKHDLAVWLAAALGLVALRRLSPVAIVAGGDRRLPVLPSLARGDLWHAIEPLRRADTAESTRLATRLDELSRRAERASLVLVISDLHDPGALGALRRAAQRHDVTVLHTIDPAESGPLRAGFFRGAEAETGRRFLSHGGHRPAIHEDLRQELVRSGIEVLELRTDRPFLAPLRRFLSSRGAALRGTR